MNQTKCFICEPDDAEYGCECIACYRTWIHSQEHARFYSPEVSPSDFELYYGRFVTRIWTERFFTPGT